MNLEIILNDKDLNEFVCKVSYNYFKRYNINRYMEYEEYKQEVYLYLIKGLKKYESGIVNIKTYLYNTIRLSTINVYNTYNTNANKTNYNTYSMEYEYTTEKSVTLFSEYFKDNTNIEDAIIANDLYNFIINKNNKSYYKQVLDLMLLGKNKVDIAKLLGLHRNTVNNIVNKFKIYIKEYYQGGEIYV